MKIKNYIYKIFFNLIFFFLKKINLFLKILNKKNFLQEVHDELEKNQTIKTEINNQKINLFCPSIKSLDRLETLYTKEPETINWINNFDNSKKIIFWDIGANIGLYSIYAATKYKEIEIISFEPSTSNTRVLSRNISINNLHKKITIFQLPLTNKPNTISDFKETNFQEGGSLSTFQENFDEKGIELRSDSIKNQYKIFGTSINYLLENNILKLPNYIKCDVDGLEHFILEGADKFLKNKDLLEISIETNSKFKDQYNKVKKILFENNFKQELYFPDKNDIDLENSNSKEIFGNLLFRKIK